MPDPTLTVREGYEAMVAYLEAACERAPSTDLVTLLGEVRLLQDGSNAHPAAWARWERAIARVRAARPQPEPTG